MAAPSGTVWGSVVQGNTSGRQGKIGIYTSVSSTNTETTVNVQVWFWTIYSCSDTSNNFYCNIGKTISSASTKIGSVTIDHDVATGNGWNTANQTRLYNVTKTYTRGTSATTYKVYAKYNGIDMLSDKTMYANASFKIPALTKYTVTFNANGGSGAPSSQTKYYGKTLTLSSTKPTRSGYTFVGWGTSTTDTSIDYAAGGSYTANASITLYAIWKKTITLSYNANGGSDAPSSQSATVYNATIIYTFTLPSTRPTRSGYTFLGWSTSNTATSASYNAGGSYTANASITLYAIWKKIITLSYNANGGLGAPASQSATVYNAATSYKFTLSSTKPSNTGHSFLGWSTSNTATSASYAAGDTITLSANDTLYAVWKADTYSVKFNANGGSLGSVPSSATKTFGETLKLPTATPTRTNYTFLGWATSATATAATYQAGANYTSNSAVTLYAIWKLAYVKPTVKIKSLKMIKNDPDGVTKCEVSYEWSCAEGYLPTNMSIAYRAASDDGGTQQLGAQTELSGTDTFTIVYGFNSDATYTFVLTLTDSQGSYTATKRIDGTAYTIHCRPGGKGVAFGKTAEVDGYADFGYDVHMNNNKRIFGTDIDGSYKETFNPINGYGNTILGYGNYTKASGDTNIYGHDISFGISNIATPGQYRPYRRREDTITLTLRTAGYITNSGKSLSFWIPMAVPVIGSPTATVSSGNGFILRQGDKYTHGSSSEVYVYPTSYSVTVTTFNGLYVNATFDNNTNVTNNDAIGIYWNGTITFS